MIDHPNSLLVHHCLQAATDGDRATLRALWSDDIVWHVKGESPFRGEIKGPDDVLEYLASLGEIGGDSFRTEVEDVLVSDEHAAVLCHTTAQRGDRTLDATYLMIVTIAGRRIREVVTVPIDAERAAAFWAD
ncbi:MAG: nuclear transport factor 2 family protein [Spirochaetaceae bacterium]|nr:nuclear transport factor 2 family protein [Myxococcales bacterium]MCB9723412.1 nuclear transport factor 2 family protein [Spirochaetaceae bacterium]HPG24494.1 nuclear transport factor 2 family protein [Myxococcota bacterium]